MSSRERWPSRFERIQCVKERNPTHPLRVLSPVWPWDPSDPLWYSVRKNSKRKIDIVKIWVDTQRKKLSMKFVFLGSKSDLTWITLSVITCIVNLWYDVHTLIPTQVRGFNDVIHTLDQSRSISTVTTKWRESDTQYKLDNNGNKQENHILVCSCDGGSLSLTVTNQIISFPFRWTRP